LAFLGGKLDEFQKEMTFQKQIEKAKAQISLAPV